MNHPIIEHLRRLNVELRVEGGKLLYRAPVGSVSADLREQIAAHRDELITFLTTPDKLAAAKGRVPSYSQRQHLLTSVLDPVRGAYDVTLRVRLDGALIPFALEQSLNEVVRRHETLRTYRLSKGGTLALAVAPSAWLRLIVVDRQNVSGGVAAPWGIDAGGPVLPLDHPPLLRAVLETDRSRSHRLWLTTHHLAADGWSMQLLVSELVAIYRAYARGGPSPLPVVATPYSEFALKRDHDVGSTVEQADFDYWQDQLANPPPPLFPARQTANEDSDGVLEFAPPATVVASLRHAARAASSTLYTILLAAFLATLHERYRRRDVLIGTTVSCRPTRRSELLIGPMSNTLVIRTRLPHPEPFEHFLASVRATTLAAFAHQETPFGRLVEKFNPARHPGEVPYFQAMFNVHSVPVLSLEELDLKVALEIPARAAAKFPLSCTFEDTGSTLSALIEYSQTYFSPDEAASFVVDFQAMLARVTSIDNTDVGRCELDAPPAPEGSCLHQMFEQRVRSRPDAVAVVCGESQVTYSELDRQANAIARRLAGAGVGPEFLIAILANRSISAIAAMIGVLKAGGAYVPLDPRAPEGRNRRLLATHSIPIVLVEQEFQHLVADHAGRVFILNCDVAGLMTTDGPLELHTVSCRNIAYVIFTSGSTGEPKGCMVTHANVTALFENTLNHFQFTHADVWALFHSTSFDFSVWEIWGALLHGSRLHVIPYEISRTPELFLQFLLRDQITVVNQTPSAFGQLLTAMEAAGISSLPAARFLILGGEAVSSRLVSRWFELGADATTTLVNMFGITETTVFSTYHALTPADGTATAGTPIGSALPGVQVFVLDDCLQPVGAGELGEIYVAGNGVCRGYLGRPDLTAERFLPALAGTSGLMYRSGDLAMQNEVGRITHLGRVDDQVKVRGFRIELGEIAAAVQSHPAVQDVLVVPQIPTGSCSIQSLVCYVVPKPNTDCDADQLYSLLEKTLPEYMVPAAIEFIEKVPMTVNGKVDRKALPAARLGRTSPPLPAMPDPIEQLMCDLMAQVLGLPNVGPHENFFHLGGHSLLATQMATRAFEVLSVDVPVHEVFTAPTPAALAKCIADRTSDGRPPIPDVTSSVPPAATAPLSIGQEAIWTACQGADAKHVYNVPMSLHILGPLNVAALFQAVDEIVRRHDVLRTRYFLDSDRPLQCALPPGEPRSQPYVEINSLPEAVRDRTVDNLVSEEARHPFDLSHDPPLRVIIVSRQANESAVVINFHHICIDGWSMGVFVTELFQLYEDFQHGRPSPLPSTSLQYVDFCVWQRNIMAIDGFQAQRAYWKEQLDGITVLRLPTDHPDRAGLAANGSRRIVNLPDYLKQSVLQLGRERGVTLFMILISCLKVALHFWTGHKDVFVASSIANRNRKSTEAMIGYFVNTFVLRVRIDYNLSFATLLHNVRSALLGAYANQDIPFETVCDDCGIGPLAHPFQVKIALQNSPFPKLNYHGLDIRPVPIPMRGAKYPLKIEVMESSSGLIIYFEYNDLLFEHDTIRRFSDGYLGLLAKVTSNPDATVGELRQCFPAVQS